MSYNQLTNVLEVFYIIFGSIFIFVLFAIFIPPIMKNRGTHRPKEKQSYLEIKNNSIRKSEQIQEGEKKLEAEIKESSQTKQGKNTLAITGFALGIVSIFIGGFIGIIPILSLIFSAIGLYQTRKRKESGVVLAIIGLILGIIYTLVYLRNYGHI